jgi:hypothetical protein
MRRANSGYLLPPSPPAEKATARQDQAGQASTESWPPSSPDQAYYFRGGDSFTNDFLKKGLRFAGTLA